MTKTSTKNSQTPKIPSQACLVCKRSPKAGSSICTLCLNTLGQICQQRKNRILYGIHRLLIPQKMRDRLRLAKKLAKELSSSDQEILPSSKEIKKEKRSIHNLRYRLKCQQKLLDERDKQLEILTKTGHPGQILNSKQKRGNTGVSIEETRMSTVDNQKDIQDSDHRTLWQLLKRPETRGQLDCLRDLALRASSYNLRGYSYNPLMMPQIDGFEVDLGGIPLSLVRVGFQDLLNLIQNETEDFILKNIQVNSRASKRYLWITLTSETSILTPRTMTQIQKTVKLVQKHAQCFWQDTPNTSLYIQLTKVDVAMDFKGSFIPETVKDTYQTMKVLLNGVINFVFSEKDSNFLSLSILPDLKVQRGDNNLDTCFQYAVKHKGGDKLLNVKVYDKMLDLFAREGCHLVGSRAKEVLGCKRDLDLFNKRLCKSKNSGMTRLEVSICKGAFEQYAPQQSSVNTQWHMKIRRAMEILTQHWLNSGYVREHAFRTLSVTKLVALLGQCDNNILAIGNKKSWLVSAKTPHARHFVGTMHQVGLAPGSCKAQSWRRLHNLVLRYASPGSLVKVFYLDDLKNGEDAIAEVKKQDNSFFQPPGCSLPNINGITIPNFAKCPIQAAQYQDDCLQGWSQAKKEIMKAVLRVSDCDSDLAQAQI